MTVDRMTVNIMNDYEIEFKRTEVILSIINSDKYRQKIRCDCTDCGGPRIKGKCEFEKVYYRKNKKKTSIRVSLV